ncbi:MAG: FAD:protein FMN transferase [Pirellulaceae bacterium]|nr:FAD:protein FMN transferase [Pirellulaceae bacterium]
MKLEQWEQRLGRWSQDVREKPVTTSGPIDSSPPIRSSDEFESVHPSITIQTPSAGATDWLDSIEQAAMACEFEVLLNHDQYPHGLEVARDALRVVHSLENELSVYRPTSDFSMINRVAHQRAVAARFDVCQLLSVARDVSLITDRAFDITAGVLSEVWGFSRRQGRKPSQEELQTALQCVNAEWVEVDTDACTVKLARPGVKLNPGGIGKGYALDRVADGLIDGGIQDFLLHGGRSSIVARGRRLDRQADGWWIALAHPLRWEEKLGRIRLRNQALGTSGAGKQFFHYQGVRYSHVIDPRSGWPVQGILSATAICGSGTLADALATAFMVMGVEATRAFCAEHPSVSAILVSVVENSSRLQLDCINVAEDAWQLGRELSSS